MNKTEQELTITGMTCGHCVMTVANALKSVTGVENAEVNLEQANATVIYDANQATPEQLIASLNETNYSASIV